MFWRLDVPHTRITREVSDNSLVSHLYRVNPHFLKVRGLRWHQPVLTMYGGEHAML
jgi:hypothetical protein